jgi:hypothetical protein
VKRKRRPKGRLNLMGCCHNGGLSDRRFLGAEEQDFSVKLRANISAGS